jgi:hypothetical protein
VPTDLKDAKKGTASVFPDGALDAAIGQPRVEAFLTPTLFKKRFFFGIPLKSPITKESLSDEDLQDFINRGANQLEMDARISVFPVLHRARLPFDPNLYYQYIYVEFPYKPIQKVLRLAIVSASYKDTDPNNVNAQYPTGAQIFPIPNDWIEMGNARKGRLNVIPINPAFTAISTSEAVRANGDAVLAFIGQLGWVPAYWTVEAMCGFCSEDGRIPQIVNEAIGLAAAIKLIDNLYPLFRVTSQSLSLDGMGQSNSDQLQQLLKQKRDDYERMYGNLVEKFKAYVGSKLFSTNV